jgi:hypothetical protein
LLLVHAVAILYLVSQGTQVARSGQRRRMDPHWFRGSSYLRIGWNWVKAALIGSTTLNREALLKG